MRTIILLLLLGTCSGAFAGQSSKNQSEGWVYIRSIRGRQPIVSVQRGEFPADHRFMEFDVQTARRWQTNYAVFSKALVEAAHKNGLDSPSLAKILQNVRTASENKGLAVLPVAAHSTKSDGEEVWVVTFRWENATWVAKDASLTHIREFTFTRKTLKQIGFSTCG
jgi:hypothetical protein